MLPTSRSQPLATRVCWHFQPTSLLAKERTEGREKRDGWMVSKHEANPCQLWYLSTERGSWAAQLQVIITREKGSINLVHHLVLFFQIQRKKFVELFGLIFFYWPLQKNIFFLNCSRCGVCVQIYVHYKHMYTLYISTASDYPNQGVSDDSTRTSWNDFSSFVALA